MICSNKESRTMYFLNCCQRSTSVCMDNCKHYRDKNGLSKGKKKYICVLLIWAL